MGSFNKLSPAEEERLALLLEEMGEAQQAIGKILRYGSDSFHPDRPHTTNREDLENELGHILFALRLMVDSGDLDFNSIVSSQETKSIMADKWLHHQAPTK